ncbi:Vezatin [Trichoplax sp. H2]|nr:Vezatin [Trichoplax sp. H2]|eukprot:RDD46074.1 Vezatin [Trichoplax sp. H2]
MADNSVLFKGSPLHQYLEGIEHGQQLDVEPRSLSNQSKVQEKQHSRLAVIYYYIKLLWLALWHESTKRQQQLHNKLIENGKYTCIELLLNNDVLLEEDEDIVRQINSNIFDNLYLKWNKVKWNQEIEKESIKIRQVLCVLKPYLRKHFSLEISKALTCAIALYFKSSLFFGTLAILSLSTFAFLVMGYFIYRLLWQEKYTKVAQDQDFTTLESAITTIENYIACSKKVVRFIMEMEVISRGFTLLGDTIPPITRIELKSDRRQCNHLRQTLFMISLKQIIAIQEATNTIVKRYGLGAKLNNLDICCPIPLYELGIVKSAQAMRSLCYKQFSEFFCCLIQACIVSDTALRQIFAWRIIHELVDSIKTSCKDLADSMETQKLAFSAAKNRLSSNYSSDNQSNTAQSQLSQSIRNFRLHLLATINRLELFEKCVKAFDDNKEQINSDNSATEGLYNQITMDINSARDCWSFAKTTVMKILNKPIEDPESRSQQDGNEETEVEIPTGLSSINTIIAEENEDKVYEAYITKKDMVSLLEGIDNSVEDVQKEQISNTALMNELQNVLRDRVAEKNSPAYAVTEKVKRDFIPATENKHSYNNERDRCLVNIFSGTASSDDLLTNSKLISSINAIHDGGAFTIKQDIIGDESDDETNSTD